MHMSLKVYTLMLVKNFFWKLIYEKQRDGIILITALYLGICGNFQSFPILLEPISFFCEFLQEHTLGYAAQIYESLSN